MAKDCQGTLRGACTLCDCRMFVSAKGIRCDYCDDPAAKHQNLSSPPSALPLFSPQLGNDDDGDDDGETVATDGGGEDDGDEDGDEDGMSVERNETLQSTFPSTKNMLRYTPIGFAFPATPAPYSPHVVPLIMTQQQQTQLPPDRRCSLPGCIKPKYIEPTGRMHDYCGKTHAMKHRGSLPVPVGGVPPHLKCSTPGCNQQRRIMPGGVGYYDYCSLSCRDRGGGVGSQEVLSPDQLCSLPGCPRPRFVDPISGSMRDYCGNTHAVLARNGGGGTGGAATFDTLSVMLKQLTSGEQARISSKFQNDWVKGQHPSVDHIFEVSSKNLEQSWKSYKDALATSGHPTSVEQHYHGTTIKCNLISSKSVCSHNDCGICGISRNGFQKSRIGSNISFKRFGHGLYLAPHSSKCHDYTQGTHTHRAMLLCDVLPGKKHVVQTDQTRLVAPPPGYDSVYGQPGNNLNYPEIVIYDEASILPRYVIVYQKDGIGKIAK